MVGWTRELIVTAVLAASAHAYGQTCPYPNNAQSFTVTPASMSTFTAAQGIAYSQGITVSGGPASGGYFWQIINGSFPPGISLQTLGAGTSTNAMAGTPTNNGGPYNIEFCIYPYENGAITPNCLCTDVRYTFNVCGRTSSAFCTVNSDCCSGYYCTGGGCAPIPADAGVDAPMPDAAMPDAPIPDAGMCKALDQSCQMTSDCCSGLDCEGDGTMNTCCAIEHSACGSNADCCAPRVPPLVCIAGACTACGTATQACTSNDQCCSGLVCNNGACAACTITGGAATSYLQCCPDLGFNTHLDRCCTNAGGTCLSDNDCCGDAKCIQSACDDATESKGCSTGHGAVGAGALIFALSAMLLGMRRNRS